MPTYDNDGNGGNGDDDSYSEGERKHQSRNVHRLRSAPMHGGRAASATQGFTVEDGHLCGYEGGRRGQSHPENAGPDQRVAKMELSTPY